MADILVKGMDMPKDCPMCPLAHWNKLDMLTGCERGHRYVSKSDVDYWQSDTRPEWCSLVEVPPHGRLIDAEELKELFRETITGIATRTDMKGAYEHMIRVSAMVIDMIDDAPTVIEASEDGEQDG